MTPVDAAATPAARDAQLALNLEIARQIAAKYIDGESALVVKARGGADHGGGTILPEGTRNLEMLEAFVRRLERDDECVEAPNDPSPDSFDDLGDDVCTSATVTDRADPSAPIVVPPIKTARLTHWQLRAIVSKVLGYYDDRIDQRMPPDGGAGPIPNTQDLELSVSEYERYQTAAVVLAEAIVARNEAREGEIFACEGSLNQRCAQAYLERVTPRLFRRPPTDGEIRAFLSVFETGAEGSFAEGMRYMLEALLIYPDTLYHIEAGRTEDQNQVERRLSGLEVASRLAFFLTARGPDEAFFAAAHEGQFDTSAGVEAFARELLDHESKARFAIQHFHQRWLNFDEDAYVTKDELIHPEFDEETYRNLRRAIVVWTAYVGLKGEGTLDALMNNATTALPELDRAAAFYGLDDEDQVDTYLQYKIFRLPEDERAGLMTRPAFLASMSNSDDVASRPILRGANILRDVFCDELAPPVNNFPPPEQRQDQTAQDDLAFTVASEPCKSCHEQINPIGLALEQYDAAGRFRVADRGQPIAVDGHYGKAGLCDEERVRFTSALEFARSLSENPRVQACYALQWFRYGLRRDATAADAGALGQIVEHFVGSGSQIKELLVAIATSRPFLYRSFATDGG